jgi:CRP-like cAMP-binding protein
MTATEQPSVCLLDALPEIARAMEPAELERARGDLVAPIVEREEGVWDTPIPAALDPLALGAFVMDGLLARELKLGDTKTAELVGRGDLLRPADYSGDAAPVPVAIEWTVLERTTVAVLDRDVTAAVCRWQPVVTAMVGAAVQRSFVLAHLLALSHLRRVDSRLLVLLWYLADRWGKVQREGVVVPLRLTHEMIGRVVGAQRPSVTTALNQLEAAGHISRRDAGGWVLHGDPPKDLRGHRPSDS